MTRHAGIPVLLTSAALVGCISDNTVEYQRNVDTFAQSPNNLVDILWVVDNSHSMTEEQATLIAGFQSFAGQLEESGTDFQLGVISTSFDYTDPDRGVLVGDPPFLTNEDDYVAEFAERATVGIEGSDKEKGLEAAVYAVSPAMTAPGGRNEGFVRAGAELLIVWVSDEEDCSDGGALEGQPATSCYTEMDALIPVPNIVEDLHLAKTGDDELLSVGAIIGTEQSTCPDVYEGSRYIQTVGLMGGLPGDICQSDWSSMMRDLGLNATGIHTRFQLSEAAQPDTIVVNVDELEVPEDPIDGWTYDVATWWLEFHGGSVPQRGAAISVEYLVDPEGVAPATSTTP